MHGCSSWGGFKAPAAVVGGGGAAAVTDGISMMFREGGITFIMVPLKRLKLV